MFYMESLVSDIPVTTGLVKFTTQEVFVSLASVPFTASVNMLMAFRFQKARAKSEKQLKSAALLQKNNLWIDFAVPHLCHHRIICFLTVLLDYSLEFWNWHCKPLDRSGPVVLSTRCVSVSARMDFLSEHHVLFLPRKITMCKWRWQPRNHCCYSRNRWRQHIPNVTGIWHAAIKKI